MPSFEAIGSHGRPIPAKKKGQHLWIVVNMYQVTPKPQGKYILDHENLLTIEGPGCYWCEEQWTPTTAAAPCRG